VPRPRAKGSPPRGRLTITNRQTMTPIGG
jgi:hypothetical protein